MLHEGSTDSCGRCVFVCILADGLDDANPDKTSNSAKVQAAGLIQAVQYLRSAFLPSVTHCVQALDWSILTLTCVILTLVLCMCVSRQCL